MDARSERAIRRGESFVWRNLHFLHYDPIELVGFELIFPTLLAQARTLDLDVPGHSCGYGGIRAAKLREEPQKEYKTRSRYNEGSLCFKKSDEKD